MKILAFGASNSSKSINKKFAVYTARQIKEAEVQIIDLNDYEMAIYSIDRENEIGIPDLAHSFKKTIRQADAIVISFAEHNGSYSVAFKNVMDWISRIKGDTWESKPFFLLATSPGRRGAQRVLDAAVKGFSHMGAKVIASFSLPSFHANFDEENGITDLELRNAYLTQLKIFREQTM